MKTKRQDRNQSWLHLLAAGVLLTGGTVLTSCEQYDLDERDPEGWDKSVYTRLEETGRYTNTVRLIDDLGYHDVLSKTGSKTLFVADDDAYSRFFANNSWGVKDYAHLSLAQKKLLLYGNMIDNSIQLNNLANVQGNPPVVGECMRRFSTTSPYDTVTILTPSMMPDNIYWKRFRDADKSIVCMMDGTSVPQIQFIEAQLKNNQITNDDYNFLFNYKVDRQPQDASINGVEVEEANIRCANGFVHKMKEVVTPLPNMAEVIKNIPNAKTFNHLMERFSAPYPDRSGDMTTQYNYLYDTSIDTIYTKRFLSLKSQDGRKNATTPDRKAKADDELLKFDPEWNAYYSANNKGEGYTAEQKDMAVIMVPSDQAMQTYITEGPGKVLMETYGSWDNVPDNVVAKLINNNMLASFLSSVPSKFNGILNDANDPMGVKKEEIDSVLLSCNGAIYVTKTVYSPTSYISVYFPAFVKKAMKIVDWAIRKNQYNVYLNALGTYYSFFIPTNGSLLEYIDPTSYGSMTGSRVRLLSFEYVDRDDVADDDRVKATIYECDLNNPDDRTEVGKIEDYYTIRDILREILETHIVIGNVEDGKQYYRTKNGMYVRVNNVQAGKEGMTVEGSYQVNEGKPLPVADIYDQSPEKTGGNGKCYVLEGQPLLGTRKTVHDILSEHAEFSEFLELLNGSAKLVETIAAGPKGDGSDDHACGGKNLSVFNTFHYTVYVPKNGTFKDLPTWKSIAENFKNDHDQAKKTEDSLKIENFLRYHIQDNSLFIGATPQEGDYETALIKKSSTSSQPRFYKVHAELTDNGITVTDAVGNKHNVITEGNLYNLQAREYQYDSADALNARKLHTSSSAVVHLIDGPLHYE